MPDPEFHDEIYEGLAPLPDHTAETFSVPWKTIEEIGLSTPYHEGLSPITTGYSQLDELLRGGFRPQSMYVLAGRTGSAKSTLATNIARRQALGEINVLFFKLEEPSIEAVWRIQAAASRVNFKDFLDGIKRTQDPTNRIRIEDGWELIRDLPIRICDARDLESIERIAEIHVDHGGKMIVIDQLSIIDILNTDEGYQRATRVSNRLRILARNLNVPILVVAQVNRPAAKKNSENEHLSCHDLRDSGCIENDAAAVILIDQVRCPEGPTYGLEDYHKYLQLIVGKNRYGRITETGKPIELIWHPSICRIDDMTEDAM